MFLIFQKILVWLKLVKLLLDEVSIIIAITIIMRVD